MTAPQQMTPTLVAAARAECRFGSLRAVRDATFAIRAGQQIAVTGVSGSGKSTLLHLIAGLLPVAAGSITWPGLLGDPRLDRTLITVVFQQPSLLESLTVVQNVQLPLLLAGHAEPQAARAAEAALAMVGIGDLRDRMPGELSGGQAQRAAVARAIAARPRLIVADEPTGHLDHDIARHVIGTLQQAARSAGAALVVATHDPAVAGAFARRWHMRDGDLFTEPAPTTVQEAP
ncbi:putative ABC transport system ATP-binding protein [Hamadaea flava]|uniref:ABC transporter ATP-binding protein n=1 Tax=Hamadaea flava TaxID=1742688 RepID=A0ABV8LXW1_9ACTN|nr:ATP-binding cassette domain-containing protein [Hamadaea flava]MCP2323500.1 putative ABC transport system ATP-binding protein [Hamadaea flava]